MRLEERQERAIALEILKDEQATVSAVEGTPYESLLHEGRTRRERTRGKDVERLDAAVAALADAARRDPGLAPVAQQAGRSWQRCRELYWKLAMSAVAVARAESRRIRVSGMDADDLFQEAIAGLLEAARRYDPSQLATFGTYARWWVRSALQKAAERSRIVRIPQSALNVRRRLRGHLDAQAANGQDARLSKAARYHGVEIVRAHRLLALEQPRSLDEPLPGQRTGSAADVLPDDSAVDPIEMMHQRHVWEVAQGAIEALDDRSQEVLRRRYGLDEGPSETLAAIAEDFGLTPQRIRQIQKAAEAELALVAPLLDALAGAPAAPPC